MAVSVGGSDYEEKKVAQIDELKLAYEYFEDIWLKEYYQLVNRLTFLHQLTT